MAEIIIAEFDLGRLTAPALNVLKAAVKHAEENKHIRLHTMPIRVFCSLAELPCLSGEQVRAILKEVRSALAILEVIDTSSPDREDLPCVSWHVFKEANIYKSVVSFEICERTFDERFLENLQLHSRIFINALGFSNK
jgi:hypothetical protein